MVRRHFEGECFASVALVLGWEHVGVLVRVSDLQVRRLGHALSLKVARKCSFFEQGHAASWVRLQLFT